MSRLTRLKQSLEALEGHLSKTNSSAGLSKLDSWQSYVDSRGLRDWEAQDRELRRPLLTELLTYPLTLARYLRERSSAATLIHVVGARAEATLPPLYWAQLVREIDGVNHIELEFVGPDIPDKLSGKSEVIALNESGNLISRSYLKGTYNLNTTKKPDLIVLYNPGLAHERLQRSWAPTLESILTSRVPTLITGLNKRDALSDFDLVRSCGAKHHILATSPLENPLASMKEHAEGLSGGIARANNFVWGWSF